MSSRATRITSTGDATSGESHLQSVHISGSSGSARLTLTDGDANGDVKFDVDLGNESRSFPLSEEGVMFRNGIHVKTATDIVAATLVFR